MLGSKFLLPAANCKLQTHDSGLPTEGVGIPLPRGFLNLVKIRMRSLADDADNFV